MLLCLVQKNQCQDVFMFVALTSLLHSQVEHKPQECRAGGGCGSTPGDLQCGTGGGGPGHPTQQAVLFPERRTAFWETAAEGENIQKVFACGPNCLLYHSNIFFYTVAKLNVVE